MTKSVVNNLVRLQKIIAESGMSSRRKAEELIRGGKVKVNGKTITTMGIKVNPEEDSVEVEGKVIPGMCEEKVYLVLNKPRGHITSAHDPEGRKTVLDLCQRIPQRIYPVGRLDYLSEGLLIMTNDGDLANKIAHPRYEITKVYEVKVFGHISERILKALRNGIDIEGQFVKPLSVRVIEQLPQKTWIEFRLKEGKNREIRRFCEAQGLTIDKLRRVAIENLSIANLPVGHYELFSKKILLQSLGLDKTGTKKLASEVKSAYQSPKKTVKLTERNKREKYERRKKGDAPLLEANDQKFRKFRKETYFETIEQQKLWRESQAQLIEEKEAEKPQKRKKKLPAF